MPSSLRLSRVMPRGDIEMNEAAGMEQIAANAERKTLPSEEQERTIESVSRLLSSGRPLSEILLSVKPTASRNQAGQSNGFSERVSDTLHTPGDTRTHPLESGSTGFREPANAAVADNQVGASVLAPIIDDDAVIAPDLSAGQQPMLPISIREARHATYLGPVGATLSWLIPTLSLAILIFAGKSLIDAGVVQNPAEATTRAIIGVLQIGSHQVGDAVTPNTTVTQPNRAEPRLPQPDPAGSQVAQPISETASADPGGFEPETAEAEPAGSPAGQSEHAEQVTVGPDGPEARLTPEQIRALLNRGDEFLSRADVEAARLLYERAAGAGNAEAAIRLGATFDPEFLTRAGLRNMPSDVNTAQHWYGRARDLQANKPQLSSVGTEVARSSEQFVTGTTAQPAIPANQPRTQTADRGPATSMQPTPRTVSSQAQPPGRPLDRHDRNHRSTNGP
jgi:hypothetical protein